MARTLDQINQDIYIDWYLAGPPPRVTPQKGETHRWLRELIDDPDLEAAEDLLEATVPSDRYIWSNALAVPRMMREASLKKPKKTIGLLGKRKFASLFVSR